MAFRSSVEPVKLSRKELKAEKLEAAAAKLFDDADKDPRRMEKLTRKGIKYLKKATALCPERPGCVCDLAFAEQRLAEVSAGPVSSKLIDDAVQRMRGCLQMTGPHPQVVMFLNDLLKEKAGMVNRYETGQDANALLPLYDEIIRNSRSVLDNANEGSDPSDSAILETIGFSLALAHANSGLLQQNQERLESFEQAAVVFQQLAEGNPKNVSVLYNYGNALLDVAKSHKGAARDEWLGRSMTEHKKMMDLVRQFENQSEEELDEDILVDEGTAKSARYNYACVLALVGCYDEAFVEIEIMLKSKTHQPEEFHRDPDFDSLRDTQKYKSLVGDV